MSSSSQSLSNNPLTPLSRVSLNSSLTNLILDSDTNQSSFLFVTNSTPSLYIDKFQNIGINTISPTHQLEINSANGSCLKLTYNNTNNYSVFSLNSSGVLTISSTGAEVNIPTSVNFNIKSHNGTNGFMLNSTLVTASAAQLNYTNVTPGTASASKALVVDASTNITGINSLTATTIIGSINTATQSNITSVGTLTSLTVSGNTNISGHNGTTTGLQLNGALVTANAIELNVLKGITSTTAQLNYTNVTPGTASASKALVLDASSNITGINSLTTTSLTVGSTNINTTNLGYIDVTPGTASASKALVLDASSNITGINSLTTSSLTVGSTVLDTGSLSYISGITSGTAAASKALVLDSSSNITGINSLTTTSLTVGSTSVNTTHLGYIDITPGTASASKALVLDASRNITNINILNMAETYVNNAIRIIKSGSINYIQSGTTNTTNSSADLFIGNMLNTTTQSARKFMIKANGNVGIQTDSPAYTLDVNGSLNTTSLYLSGSQITSTAAELNTVSGITSGTITESKAVIVDANKDISGFRNITTTGSITGVTSFSASGDISTSAGRVRMVGSDMGLSHTSSTTPNPSELFTLSNATITAIGSVSSHPFSLYSSNAERMRVTSTGLIGINTTNPDRQLEINHATGECLRLTYNDTNGSATYYSDFSISSSGQLTIAPSSSDATNGDILLKGNIVVGKDASTNLIRFNGTTNDASTSHTVIGERIYGGTEQSELILFKGNDPASTSGPDRIRMRTAEYRFQTYTSAEDFSSIADNNNRLIISNNGDVDIVAHNGTNGLKLGGTIVTATAANLNALSGVTAGTVTASKALVVDSNSDLSGIRNLTLTGSITGVTNLAATITTAAQPNITSLGALTLLSISNSAASSLKIDSSSTSVITGTTVTSDYDMYIRRGTSTNGVTASIAFLISSVSASFSSPSSSFVTSRIGANGAADFYINVRDSTNLNERFRIKSAGNIGISTNNPSKQLEINSATGDCLRLTYNNATGTATNYGDITVSATGGITITSAGSSPSFTLTGGAVTISDTTASISNSTGALKIAGGIGISNTTDAISSTNGGTFTTAGGMAIAKKLYVGTDVSIGNDLFVTGNMTVSGTTTTINTTSTVVKDNTLLLSSGPTNSNIDSGLLIQRFQTINSSGAGDVVNDTAKVNFTLASATTSSITLPSGASASDNYYLNWWIKITSGAANNQVRRITGYTGATKVATLSDNFSTFPSGGDTVNLYNKPFSTFIWQETNKRFAAAYTANDSSNASLTVLDYADLVSNVIIGTATNASTSTSTGALRLSGGIGITDATDAQSITNGGTFTSAGGGAFAKSLYVGTTLTATTLTGTLSSGPQTGITAVGTLSSLTLTGGITGVTSLSASGAVTFTAGTTSSSTTTGTVVVTGGVGISGATNIGGALTVSGNISGNLASGAQTGITSVGTLTSLTSSGAVTFTAGTTSSSTTTGTVVVTGGVGISGATNIGGALTVSGNISGTLASGAQTGITSVGTLTGLTSSGAVSITNSTTSTTSSTGALIVTGGVGIGGAVNIGGALTVSGNITGTLASGAQTGITSVGTLTSLTSSGAVTFTSGTASTTTGTGALVVTGGVGIGGAANIGGVLKIESTTSSSNTTTGALVVTGGVGIGGAVNIGGALSVTGNITGTLATAAQTSITSVGTLTSLSSSGAVTFTSTTSSTTTGNGALVVNGGVGIAKELNVGRGFKLGGTNYDVSGAFSASGSQFSTAATTYTDTTSSSGTISTVAVNSFGTPTLASTNAITITNAATLFITNAPQSSSGNTVLTNAYSLLINSGKVAINDSTVSSSTVSGALVIAGGVGIGGAVNIGGALSVTGNITGTLASGSQTGITSVGTLTGLTSSGVVSITNSTTSSSTTTGALTVTGGVGISGALNVGGNITGTLATAAQANITSVGTLTGLTSSGAVSITNSTTSSSTTTGALTVTGGVGISGTLYAGGSVRFNNGSVSSSSSSGALVVSGGVGIGNNLNVALAVVAGLSGVSGAVGNSTSGIQFRTGATSYTTGYTGTLASTVFSSFARPTWLASTAGTVTTEASTVYIENSPLASTNMTITNAYSLCINAGVTALKDTTASSSTTTGALIVTGGVGIGGALNIGGALSVTGNITGTLATAAQTSITSVGTLTGLTSSGAVSITDTTASTTTSTGALIVTGGVGIGGALNVGGALSVTGNITGTLATAAQTSITSVGTLTGLTSSGAVSITDTTVSTSTTTGALTVSGGVGINGNVNIGGNRTLASWSLTGPQFNVAGNTFTESSTASGTNNAELAINSFQKSTLAASNANITFGQTIANVYIADGPNAGTNATITRKCALLTGGAIVINPGSLSISNWSAPLVHFKSGTSTTVINDTGASNITGIVGTNEFNGVLYTSNTVGRTMTRAATVHIINQPSAGTNMTITNRHALYVAAGNTTLADSSASTTTSSGALVVTGGVGIGGALNIGNTSSITSANSNVLNLSSSNTTVITPTSNTNLYDLYLRKSTTTNGQTVGIGFHLTTNGVDVSRPGGSIIFTRTSASAGDISFTTDASERLKISSSGVVTISNTAASTSITTGALVVSGGIGIGGALNVSGNITGTLATAAQGNITSVGTLTGLTSSGIVSITNTTDSTSSSTGALVMSGGVGINDTADAVSSTNGGSLTTAGGMAIAKKLFVGTDVSVGGNLTVTGNLTISGTTTTVDTTATLIKDNTLTLNSGPAGTGYDSGVLIQRFQDENNAGTGDVVNDTAEETYAISSATSTTVTLPSGANTTIDYYKDWYIKITSGAGNNQVRKVTGYTGSTTRVLTLNTSFATTPSASDTIDLYNKPISTILWQESNKQFITAFTSTDVSAGALSIIDYADLRTNSLIANRIRVGDSTDTTASRMISALDSTITTGSTNRLIAVGKASSANNQAEMMFNWTADGSSSNNLRLGLHSAGIVNSAFILGNGNMGIGTSLPDRKLEINSSTGNCLRLTYNDTDGTATTYCDQTISSAGVVTLAAAGSAPSFVMSGGAVSITNTTASTSKTTGALTVSGGVGVGGAVTANSLEAVTTGSTNVILSGSASKFRLMAHTDNVCYIQTGDSSGTTNSSRDLFIGDYGKATSNLTSTNRRFIIKGGVVGTNADAGFVGIGTIVPSKQLEVRNATGDCLRLSYDDTDYFDTTVSSTGVTTWTATGSASRFTFAGTSLITLPDNTSFKLTSDIGTADDHLLHFNASKVVCIGKNTISSSTNWLEVASTGGALFGGNVTIEGILDVTGASNAYFGSSTTPILTTFIGGSGDVLTIDGTGSGTGGRNTILFKGNAYTWEFGTRNSTANPNNAMYFFSKKNDGTENAYRMTMLVDGKIGLGTTVPATQLEINSATGSCLQLTYNDSNGGATTYCRQEVSSTGVVTFTAAGSAPSFTMAGGEVDITDTTASTSTTTGALVVSGGIGLAGNMNLGGVLAIGRSARSTPAWGVTGAQFNTNATTYTDTSSTSGTVSSVVFNSFARPTLTTNSATSPVTYTNAATVYINNSPTVSGTGNNLPVITNTYSLWIASGRTLLADSTASSSTTTGTLVVTGGIGIGGNSTIGGALSITDTTASTSATTGALKVSGGAGISHLVIGGNRSLATWSTTGALFRTVATTLTDTSTVASGDAVWLAANVFATPTFAATNTNVTVGSGAVNLYVNGPPSQGTNMTFTRSYALYVNGNMYMGANKSIREWNMGIQLMTSGGLVTDAITAASGTISTFGRTYEFGRSTFAATNTSVTLTNAATVYIDNAPINGTNMTITNAYALYAAAGKVRFADSTASSSTTTGALTVTGGVGIGGNSTIGGILSITDTTASTSYTTGALKVSGGVGIDGAIYSRLSNNLTGHVTFQRWTNDLATDINVDIEISNTSVKFGTSSNTTFSLMTGDSSAMTISTTNQEINIWSNTSASSTLGNGALQITSGGLTVGRGISVGGSSSWVDGAYQVIGSFQHGGGSHEIQIQMAATTGDSFMGTKTSNKFCLMSNNLRAITIDTSQRVGIGISAPSALLELGTDSAKKPTTNTWTISSDIRVKEDIVQADVSICYNKIKNLQLKYFKWKDDFIVKHNVTDHHQLGWIAQDVEQFIPKAVEVSNNETYNISDFRSLNSSQIYANMFGAIQKLIQDKEALEAENQLLKQQIQSILQRLDNLESN